ncbi:MAG: TetR/AcrR family transcriptional regulator, partial [Pseudolysinimonas sp.]
MDPRIARTRDSLQQALLELASDNELGDIAVADIVERAGVNRSTFYQHYADKETLLADALDAAVEQAGAELPDFSGPLGGPPDALLSYLRHLDEHAAVYRRVLGEHGSPVVTERLRARIEAAVSDTIGQSSAHIFTGLPVDVVAAGIAGSVMGVLSAWIAREPRPSPETAGDWVW